MKNYNILTYIKHRISWTSNCSV